MGTNLYIISNIQTSKEEVVKKKDWYLKQLKALNLNPVKNRKILNINPLKEEWEIEKGDWEYGFRTIYNEETGYEEEDIETEELIYFESPFVFSVRLYTNCLEIHTIYRYKLIYEQPKLGEVGFFWNFRKEIFDIISIFGGTEIIYLADNSCDKLSHYLGNLVWEGVSYNEVKTKIINSKIPIVSDYYKLNYEELSYSNIKEVVFDDFSDLKK